MAGGRWQATTGRCQTRPTAVAGRVRGIWSDAQGSRGWGLLLLKICYGPLGHYYLGYFYLFYVFRPRSKLTCYIFYLIFHMI
ncbi:hypothetical protein E1A91_D07G012000v1 [Gossypium mustelinum]|uniref:Uncharacterized protein n=1 Tax=Gossypium mustelinum TaxID=34275 RepID=A0A5D2U571_GOSMU|nr:hypothetical protein E1A91_D07G012000v1 [Gossypium mustelinum]